MTNIMEVPSVAVYVETQSSQDFIKNITRFNFEIKFGKNKWGHSYAVTDEVMATAKITFLKIEIAARMAKTFHDNIPWLDQQWIRNEIEKILELQNPSNEAMLQEWNPSKVKASAGTHNKEEPLAEWEKELLDHNYKPHSGPSSIIDKTKSTGLSISGMANGLPGMKAKVLPPCGCYEAKTYLKEAIMHINDDHAPDSALEFWSSDRLCDWLDELHDSGVVDLEVQIPDKEDK